MTHIKDVIDNGTLFVGMAATFALLRISIDIIIESTTKVAKAVKKEKKNKKSKKIPKPFQAEDIESRPSIEDVSQQSEEDPMTNGKLVMQATIASTSVIIHSVILVYSLAVAGLRVKMADIYGDYVQVFYTFSMGCIAVVMATGLIHQYRDRRRLRFGRTQRALYILGATSMIGGSIVSMSGSGKLNYPQKFIGIANFYFSSVYAILAAVECCFFPLRAKKENKKATLSLSGTIMMLRPYFWPNNTTRHAHRNRLLAILAYICVASSKACSLVSPILIGSASTAIIDEKYSDCIRLVILYACAQFAASLFKESQGIVYLHVAKAAYVQLSNATFEHLHELSLEWHLHRNLGATLRSMDRGINACDTLMKHLCLWLIPALAECIAVCVIYATYFKFFYLAISTFYFVFVYVIVTVILALKRKHSRRKVNKSDNEWHDICTESLVNYETVKCHAAEDFERKAFSNAIERYSKENVGFQTAISSLHIGQQFVFQACMASSLIIATAAIKNGSMSVGDFVAVLSYTINLFQPLNYLAKVYSQILTAAIDLQNLSELRALVPDVSDSPNAKNLSLYDGPDFAIEFENVVFKYPTQSEGTGLKGLSFKVKRGSKTAIVGSTGAGKTTIGRLLLRFYDAIEGTVKVNGVNVKDISQKSLRKNIGCVPQFPTMFNKSLKYNIKYGNQNASDHDLERVCKDAQLWDFIQSLPKGWDTTVGDRGLKLSGGEKQRTAIARCLLNRPPIVFLDEATSALDILTESRVKDALNNMGSGRTSLVIAHRLGTIRDADKIIVIDGGVVAEEGTHDELLAFGGIYENMWNLQSKKAKSRDKGPLMSSS